MNKIFKPSREITIEGKKISNEEPVYFIAEIGSNFDQDITRAKELIFMAKEAGADAAKFQHYTAASLVSDRGFKNLGGSFSHQSSWKKSVFDTYDEASLNKEWTKELKDTCSKAEITFFTSPYSKFLVDYVDPFVPAYKVGSGDITWTEIIDFISSKNKPVLLATGAANMDDVKRAVKSVLLNTPDLVLMQCNTNYTARHDNYDSINLNVLKAYKNCFNGVITGLSDHMPGYTTVLGAVALGARVIEKHFTDSTKRIGPDHPFSMDLKSFTEMVDRTRELQASLGDGVKKVEENEQETIALQQRSICAAKPLTKGIQLERVDLDVLRPRPTDSIPPYEMNKVIGKKLIRDIAVGEKISWNDLE